MESRAISHAFTVSDSSAESEVAGGYAALLQVFLVVFFRAIERACRCDFRHDGALEFAAGVERCT